MALRMLLKPPNPASNGSQSLFFFKDRSNSILQSMARFSQNRFQFSSPLPRVSYGLSLSAKSFDLCIFYSKNESGDYNNNQEQLQMIKIRPRKYEQANTEPSKFLKICVAANLHGTKMCFKSDKAFYQKLERKNLEFSQNKLALSPQQNQTIQCLNLFPQNLSSFEEQTTYSQSSEFDLWSSSTSNDLN